MNHPRFLSTKHPKRLHSLKFSTQPTQNHQYHDNSILTQTLKLLETPREEWDPTKLNNLLFPTTNPPSSRLFFQITRRLPSSSQALHFLHYLRYHSPNPQPQFLSLTFQAILELATREKPDPSRKLLHLFDISKRLNIPLTVNAATLLIRFLGINGLVDDSVVVFSELEKSVKDGHVYTVLVDVLLRNGRVGDAFKVLDEMLQPGFELGPDKFVGDVLFYSLSKEDGKRREGISPKDMVGLVLRFGERGVFPNPIWFTQLVNRLCRSGKVDEAWELVFGLMKLGRCVEVASCNALLTGLGKVKDSQRMNALLVKMKVLDMKPDAITLGILINMMCKDRRVDEALEVLEKMSESEENGGVGIEPDVVIFNTVIDGLCKVGRQEEGMDLMRRMKWQKGCSPNAVTYGCLIDGFCKAGEIGKGVDLFDEMEKEGIFPSVSTFNCLIGGMCKHEKTGRALELFREMKSRGLKGDAITYTTLIAAFSSVNNIEKAVEIFDQMSEDGCSPDTKVYHSLISGLCLAGRLNDASSVFLKMKEAGLHPDVICYNSMIGGFCKRKRMDKAYLLIKEMEEDGLQPDPVTYNTLISHFSKAGYMQMAHKLLRKMTKDGLPPSVITYGALIHAYCVHGDVDEAMKIFKGMETTSRVMPNTVIYNILIDFLSQNNNVELALSLMDDMRNKGVRPNTNTYNSIFKGLREKKLLEKVFEMMDQMIEDACNPDYITIEILTEWLSAVGETKKLSNFVQGYGISALVSKVALGHMWHDSLNHRLPYLI